MRQPGNNPALPIILCAIYVHVLLICGAFDLYFSSPIDKGMNPVRTTDIPPAKRVVLMVADGLRADLVYGKEGEENAPYLKSIREGFGSWGIAHTRVPTESRPGHVALLAGIYEDPSAIFKGWQANPVDFDSVINQSTNTWCWGSPDILNLFNKDNSSHVHINTYDSQMEDFGKEDTSLLDNWVFDRVEKFLEDSDKLDEHGIRMANSGNLFFLHLLGIDTAGHGFKPFSKQYLGNIKTVDSRVAQIEKVFEKVFPEGTTTYIFTSDHGMTDWGSHGAGSSDETETPIIAWGAGIKKESMPKDIRQIDVAPLIAALLGINIPTNSMGQLPYRYLDVSLDNLCKIMLANVNQRMEIFNIKRQRIRRTSWNFVPFKGITTDYLVHEEELLNFLLKMERHELFVKEWHHFMKLLDEGCDYYHNYYQLSILMAITIGMTAWITYLGIVSISTTKHLGPPANPIKYSTHVIIVLVLAVLVAVVAQSLPWMYFLYYTFPIVMLRLVVNRHTEFIRACKIVKKQGIYYAIAALAGLEFLVVGFYVRACYSIVLCLMSLWVHMSPAYKLYRYNSAKKGFFLNNLVLSIFPLLPVMKTAFHVEVFLFGVAFYWTIIQICNKSYDFSDRYTSCVFRLQHFTFLLAVFYFIGLEYKWFSVDPYFKYLAWTLTLFPITIINYASTQIFSRIAVIFLAFGPFYVMVSPGYEMWFLSSYICVIYYWMKLEINHTRFPAMHRLSFDDIKSPFPIQEYDDFRRGFFYITFLLVGFFGTGNIASVNSFDPMWVRCFMTVFSPFKMTAIILVKIMIPFVYVTCILRALHVLYQNTLLVRFSILLFFSDIMLIQFLYFITNVGSWLDIGTSLSHFIIMDAFVIIILMLYGVVYFLTTIHNSPK